MADIPVGISLHQWKRGADFRNLICPPAGYSLLELDFAGQEFGLMAVASKDPKMLELRAPGEDAHSYMGAQIERVDYKDLMARVKAGDKEAALQRKLGKFCIAEDELVLTDRGLIPIQYITLDMLVWDGVEWVKHMGLIYQGEREVISYEGITATPDHKVYLQNGDTCEFGTAATEGYRIATSGDGRHPIRLMVDHEPWRSKERQRDSDLLSMPVRRRTYNPHAEPTQWEESGVQKLCFEKAARIKRENTYQQCCCRESTEESQFNASALPEPKRSIVSQLRGSWDSVQLCECERGYSIRLDGATTHHVSTCGHRPYQQRRALRSGEPTTCNTTRELNEYPKNQIKKTYDLFNAGPRHRFTVGNHLVGNCNLSFQYRIGAKAATIKAKVEYGLDLTQNFVQSILNTYKASYPSVPLYWHHSICNSSKSGYAETFAGRRINLNGNWLDPRTAWALESTAINYPIQGTGGDQKYLALAVARNVLPQMGGYFYYELHDGLFFILPTATAERDGRLLRRLLSNLPYKQAWGWEPGITFPVDLKMGPSWGSLKEIGND